MTPYFKCCTMENTGKIANLLTILKHLLNVLIYSRSTGSTIALTEQTAKLKGPKVYIYQTAYSILPFSLPTDPLGGHILYIIKPHLCQPSPTQNHCVAN